MNNTVIIIEGTAYRLSERGLLESLKLGQTPVLGEFRATTPETRNMTADQDHHIKEALKTFLFLFPDNRRSAVQQRAMKGRTEPAKAKLPRQYGKGAKSEYQCNVCLKSILTVDRDSGEIWAKIPCNQTHQCKGSMIPHQYLGKEAPEYEWRRPTDQEINASVKGGFEQEYLKKGGLIMVPFSGVKVTRDEQAEVVPETPQRPAKVMNSRRAKLGLEV